jgi:hypothetical protein
LSGGREQKLNLRVLKVHPLFLSFGDIMSKHKKSLIAVAVCALAFGASALLPADLSPIGSSYAAGNGGGGGGGNGGGGGHGGGNGGGNGGGHGAGIGGGQGHDKSGDARGLGKGLASDHTGTRTRTRDHGVSGKHTGATRTDRTSKASLTSTIAKDRDTRGLTKASAISTATPGTHNTKGLTNATSSSIKNDR